ncbi:hypothetical protein E2C01_080287 [Portunus trituberculatus]|uniref:Uncharacterized protein n=1 Tax=Portunus trituberculatus TaxID=210409 RepID=A0A5B7IY00_PORTR|nr:hypothetical protein [Portunus trituberculatus]
MKSEESKERKRGRERKYKNICLLFISQPVKEAPPVTRPALECGSELILEILVHRRHTSPLRPSSDVEQ